MQSTPQPGERPQDPAGKTSINVRAALRGDAASLEWTAQRLKGLFEVKARMLVRGAKGCGVDADDLVQEMWLAALPNLHRLKPKDGRYTPALLAYLGTALDCKLQDALRVRLRRRAHGDIQSDATVDPVSPSAGPASVAETRDVGDAVRQALAFLGVADQELIVLRVIDRMPYAVLGKKYGLKANTVGKRFARALEQLERALPPSVLAEIRSAEVADAPDDAGLSAEESPKEQ